MGESLNTEPAKLLTSLGAFVLYVSIHWGGNSGEKKGLSDGPTSHDDKSRSTGLSIEGASRFGNRSSCLVY
jgi:hypothetical protein